MTGERRQDEWNDESAERAAAAEGMFRLLVESVKDYAIFMLSPAGVIATWNAGAQLLKGYVPHEAIGKHFSLFYTPADAANGRPQQLLDAAIKDGRVEDEGWRVRKDGTRFWADVVITAVHDSSGALRGFAKVTRDLTGRRASEERLRESEESLAATLYSIGDGVLATDAQARIKRINGVAARLTGWSEAEAIGRHVDDVFNIVNEETRAKAINPVDRVLKEGIIVGLANHTALISRDGTEHPIADSGAPIRDVEGNTQGAVLVFRDVTEERRAEDALRQSEERLRLMIASVQDYALYMLDPNGVVATWNSGAERIKGYREAEIIGSHFSRFFPPEDIAAGKPARELERARVDGRFEEESWRVRKDGSRFWANVVLTTVHNSSGELIGYTKITRDLTERRRLEEERLQLAQAQEAIRLRDEFLSIASHELKTPLTALQLQLGAVRERLESVDETLSKKMERAARSGDRLADLIEALLDVSRIATGRLALNLESFDLVEAAREVVERVAESAQLAECTLTFKGDGELYGSWDRLRVEQILTNLLANGFKYAARTPIEVSVSRDGEMAVLDVKDGGRGIAEKDLARIFGRFERAALMSYGGLGLGLYIAREIAAAHGGTLSAANVAEGGARFTVRLPHTPPLEKARATSA